VKAYFIVIMVLFSLNSAQAQYDVSTSFPGGQAAYNVFIQENLSYPNSALDARSNRIIKVLVNVDSSGVLTIDTFLLPYSGLGFEEEVTRFISIMPAWDPAIHNGRLASSQVILQYNFTYQDQTDRALEEIEY
jgi:protein TonB